MNDDRTMMRSESLEADLGSLLRAYSEGAVSGLSGAVVAQRLAATRPLGRGRTVARSSRYAARGMPRWAWIAVALTVAGAVLGGVLFAGARPAPWTGRSLLVIRNGSLLSVPVSGGQPIDLGPAYGVSRSLDGGRIAVTDLDRRLWVMDGDGSNRRQLSLGDCYSVGSWSPDDRSLLAACRPSIDGEQPWTWAVLGVASGSSSPLDGLSPYKDDGIGDWSPDGTNVVVPTVDGIVVAGANGETLPHVIGERSGLPWLPRWSPDGATIAYEAAGAVRLVRPDGAGDRRLIGRSACDLRWSPDGRLLALAVASCSLEHRGPEPVRVIDPVTGVDRLLSSPLADTVIWRIAWSPDSSRLALLIGPPSGCGGNQRWSAWIVTVDGHETNRLASDLDCGVDYFSGFAW